MESSRYNCQKKTDKRKKVIELTHAGASIKPLEVPYDTNLLDAVKIMIEKNEHRVIVYDENKKLANLITQSRIIKIISATLDSIPKSKKTLKDLGLAIKDVITVPQNKIAYEVFKIMLDKKVSAVGIVDDNGILVGSLSTSDIKALGYKLSWFEMLDFTVEAYLQNLRMLDPQRTIPFDKDPVTCVAEDTLGKVINMIQYYRIHRVFVVDNVGKPIGVVSLVDILCELLKYGGGLM